MTTISLKLPEPLLARLEKESRARRITKSSLVRECLEKGRLTKRLQARSSRPSIENPATDSPTASEKNSTRGFSSFTMPTAPASPLVALDTNVVMDLGEGWDAVPDVLTTIRRRLRFARVVIPPTPQQELLHIARSADTAKERNTALPGIQAARHWRIVPVNPMPVGHGIVTRVADRLRKRNLLPAEEINFAARRLSGMLKGLLGGRMPHERCPWALQRRVETLHRYWETA